MQPSDRSPEQVVGTTFGIIAHLPGRRSPEAQAAPDAFSLSAGHYF
jgi:hypothetical protein